MNRLLRFIKTSMIYLFGNILSKIISFFLLPLYTSKIDPAQFGDYDLIIALLNVVYSITFFQIWDSMFRYSFDYKKDADKYGIISNSMCVSLFGSFLYVLTMIIISFIYKMDYFVYICVLGFFEAIRYLYSFAARVFLKNKLFVLSGTINTLVTALLNVYLIVFLKWDIKALYFAAIIGCFIQIVIIEFNLHLISSFRIKKCSKQIIKEMLKFSIPLCVASISYWLLSGLTKVIITYYLGSYSNGMYAVSNKFASMITLFVTVFQYAWNESAYLLNKDKNRNIVFSKCVKILFELIIYGTGAIICFIEIIFPYFIDPNYYNAKTIIPTCLIGVAFNSIAGFLATLFMTEKKTKYVLTSTLIAAVLNIIACIPLTVKFGLQGAIIALDFSFCILMVLRLIRLYKVMNIKFSKSIYICIPVLIFSIIVFYSGNIYVNLIFIAINAFMVLFSTKELTLPILKKMKRSTK